MLSRKRRHATAGDDELELVPVMNMFLVLIPFLLLSASFYHIKAINTSVPVLAATSTSKSSKVPPKSDAKITVIVELKEKSMVLTATCDTLSYNELVKLETEIPVKNQDIFPMDKLSQHLLYIKDKYPKSDTVILVPAQDVAYGTIIQTMDTARSNNNAELFPNVVLSGKVS
jgi:biopolymer transport protein ExbD